MALFTPDELLGLGRPREQAPPKEPGWFRSAGDSALSLAGGVLAGGKMLTDVAGAGNVASETLQRGIDWLADNHSDYSKWEQLTSAREMQEAAESGSTWEEVKAAGRAFGRRPVDFLLEAAGTSLPTIAAAFLPGGQGALLGRLAMLGMGGAQGAGATKGQIFDEVHRAWKEAGADDDEARGRAEAAQEYLGSNAGQIAIGTALGSIAGATGVEAGILGARSAAQGGSLMARATDRVPRFLMQGAKEAIPEAAQGGHEQLAGNLALQNEGWTDPAMAGVAGGAVLEGLAGGAFGAATSPLTQAPQERPDPLKRLADATNVDEAIAAATEAAVPSQPSPLLALSQPAPTEATVEEVPDTFADRVQRVREQMSDPRVRDGIRQKFGDGVLNEATYYAGLADNADVNLPDKTRDRMLSLAERLIAGVFMSVEPTAAPQPLLESAQRPALPAPAGAPRIGMDTTPTGTLVGDAQGVLRPETRAEAVSRQQRIDEAESLGRSTPRGAERMPPAPPAPLPALPYDTTPTGRMIGGPAGVSRETKADAINAEQARRAVRPGDLLTIDGKPYGTRSGAAVRARKDGGEVVEVDGGWVVRRGDDNQPDVAGAAGVAAGAVAEQRADAGGSGGAVGPVATDAGRGSADAAAAPVLGGGEAVPVGDAGKPDPALNRASGTHRDGSAWTADYEPKQRGDGQWMLTRTLADPDGTRRQYLSQDGTWTNGEPSTVAVTGATPIAGAETFDSAERAMQAARDQHGEGAFTTPLTAAAREAATSEHNDRPEPTAAQKEAGNYKKGHAKLAGLDLSIENPAGSERSGTDKDGKSWSVKMRDHYGYIRGTVGKDKDHIDVFVKPGTPEDYAGDVYVVDQYVGGKFDEHKVMIGFDTEAGARAGYRRNYAKGWDGMHAVTRMSMPDFKAWLASGDTKREAAAPAETAPPAEAPAEQPKRPRINKAVLKRIAMLNKLKGCIAA